MSNVTMLIRIVSNVNSGLYSNINFFMLEHVEVTINPNWVYLFSGSVVSITCMDDNHRVVHYASDVTDELGQFDFNINMNVCRNKKLNPKLCRARLLSSPDSNCNILTDFACGRTGVSLRWPTSVSEDSTTYTLGPFYFTTQTCQKTETSSTYCQDNLYGHSGNY